MAMDIIVVHSNAFRCVLNNVLFTLVLMCTIEVADDRCMHMQHEIGLFVVGAGGLVPILCARQRFAPSHLQ